MIPGPTFEHALAWLRAGEIAPDPAADPRAATGSEALDRTARVFRAVFSDPDGQLVLQTICEASLFRAPVDHRLSGAEYRQHAQTRFGQNQLAATILAYLDHAEALERKDHDRSRSPGSPGQPAGDASGLTLNPAVIASGGAGFGWDAPDATGGSGWDAPGLVVG